MLKRQASIVRATEAADRLVASSKTLGKIRELLLGESWGELHNMLGAIEQAAPMHELCVDEARRASV